MCGLIAKAPHPGEGGANGLTGAKLESFKEGRITVQPLTNSNSMIDPHQLSGFDADGRKPVPGVPHPSCMIPIRPRIAVL